MEKKNDLVYILGKESAWLNNELRYSLRSVEKYLKNYRKVFVFGECPHFLDTNNIIHVPNADTSHDKAVNIKNKLVAICSHADVSEDFMFFNDDYFLMGDVDASNYEYQYKCDLNHSASINRTIYREHVLSTIDVLKEKGLCLNNFDTHKPIIYNKEKLMGVIFQYRWDRKFNYVMRSLYCNTLGIEGVLAPDCKINIPMPLQRWKDKTKVDCFSISDRAINLNFKTFIDTEFHHPSVFEKPSLL
jgi:hypothetical protein